ncbi:cytochrome b [Paraburkholderia sp. J8-2]|uniref:cytochrome b n=1 Tax=Paraburkholderia sp. J8-2 TaxID=2805440 RepID=UPI002AB7534A|nr:cytochrome b/b6 domain-containing protein [Paraburkholderia sp. J8-2]
MNEAGTPAYFAESAAHCLLYVLTILALLLGWLKTNAAGHAASFFGLLSLPTLLSRGEELSHWLVQFHAIAAYSLAALIGLHMLGALVNRLLKGRNILPRIPPFTQGETRTGVTEAERPRRDPAGCDVSLASPAYGTSTPKDSPSYRPRWPARQQSSMGCNLLANRKTGRHT